MSPVFSSCSDPSTGQGLFLLRVLLLLLEKVSLEPLNTCQTREIADREVKIFLFSPCFLSSCINNQTLVFEGNYSEAARVNVKLLGVVCEEDMQKI